MHEEAGKCRLAHPQRLGVGQKGLVDTISFLIYSPLVLWQVELLERRVERELDALAVDVRQRFLRIVGLIEKHGLDAMREPHIKHLEGRLWEMRMKGKDGIARAHICDGCRPARGSGACVRKEDAEDSTARARNGAHASQGG
jgi:hypothetical protein